MRIPSRTPGALLSKSNPVGQGRRATLLFDVQADRGQTNPLDDIDVEMRMIRLMLLEMARNDFPVEQYDGLGLPVPRRTGPGNGDEVIEMPDDVAIRAACVLDLDDAAADRIHGGNGQPNMPLGPISWEGESVLSGPNFPDNLRLRPGYSFGRAATTT